MISEGISTRLIAILRRKAVHIAVISCLAGVFACIWTIIQKPVYLATTVLLYPMRPSNLTDLSAVPGVTQAVLPFTSGPNLLRINQEIMESEVVLDRVLAEVPSSDRTVSSLSYRKKLKRSRRVSVDVSRNTLSLVLEGTDRSWLAKLSRAHIVALAAESSRLNLFFPSADAKLLQEQLELAKRDLEKADEELRNFQESSKTSPVIVNGSSTEGVALFAMPGKWRELVAQSQSEVSSLDAQINGIMHLAKVAGSAAVVLPSEIPTAKKWRDKLIEVTYAVKVAEVSEGAESPQVLRLKREVELAREQLELEVERYLKSLESKVVNPELSALIGRREGELATLSAYKKLAAIAPREAAGVQLRLRAVAQCAMNVQRLESRLLAANMASVQDPNRWSILEECRLSDEPVNKSIVKNTLLATICSALVCIVAVYGLSLRS